MDCGSYGLEVTSNSPVKSGTLVKFNVTLTYRNDPAPDDDYRFKWNYDGFPCVSQ